MCMWQAGRKDFTEKNRKGVLRLARDTCRADTICSNPG